MGLNHEVADIAITGGLDLKTNAHQVNPPHVTAATNVIYQTTGSLRKRNGFTALVPSIIGGGGLTVTNGKSIQNVNGELCFADGNNFYVYSPLLNAWENRGLDTAGAVILNALGVAGNQSAYLATYGNACFADVGNIRCIVYNGYPENSPGASTIPFNQSISVGIWDLVNNRWIVTPQLVVTSGLGPVGFPTVIAFGAYFYVFFIAASSTTTGVRFPIGYVINPATVTSANIFNNGVSGLGTLAFSSLETIADCYIDAAVNSSKLMMVTGPMGTSAPTATLYACTLPGSNVLTSVVTTTGTYGRHTISMNSQFFALTASPVSVTAGQGGGTTTVLLPGLLSNYTLGTPLTGLFAGTLTSPLVSGFGTYGVLTNALMVCEPAYVTQTTYPGGSVATLYNVISINNVTFQKALTYPWTAQTDIYPISKPQYNAALNDWVIWCVATGQTVNNLQPTAFLGQMINNTVLARASYDVAAVYTIPNTPPSTLSYPQTNFAVPLLSGQILSTVSVQTTAAKQIVPQAQGAFITGSRPTYYDTTLVREMGWDSYPEITGFSGTVGSYTTTLGLTPGTTYFYTSIYRTYDNAGKLILSSPGPVQQVTLGTGGFSTGAVFINLAATTPWPQYNNKQGNYTATLYRTTAADSLDFREIGQLPGFGATTVYTDFTSDSALSANGLPFLYAPPVGGELQNDPPPACTYAVASQQRIFVASSEYPYRIYFSKPSTLTRAPEFNAQSYVDVDPPTGPITALAILDGILIIFKASSIYILTGVGPDANGAGQFDPVTRLASDDGCVSSNSVLLSSQGLFFQSARGLQILDRSRTVQYIGAPVEPLTSGATITASLLLPAVSQVRFWLSTGIVLVYDYLQSRWSTFSSVQGYYASSACFWNGSQVTLDTVNGAINVETTGFTDSIVGTTVAAPITMTVETPWLKYTEAQTWNRLRRVSLLGDYKSTSTATLYFGYDWNTTYTDTVTLSSQAGLLGSDTVYQWRVRAPRQVMQALRLKLVDTTVSGESYDLTNFALEYAIRGGMARLPGQKSV